MSIYGDLIFEKVYYNHKYLNELINNICKKITKFKNVSKAKFSDYHGSSLDITLKNITSDEQLNDIWKSIKNVINEEIKKFEKKYNSEYSWDVKVSTFDGILVVFDVDILNESASISKYKNIENFDMLKSQWKDVFKYIIDKFSEYYINDCKESVSRKDIEQGIEITSIESYTDPKGYTFIIGIKMNSKFMSKVKDRHYPAVEISFDSDRKFNESHSRIYFDG